MECIIANRKYTKEDGTCQMRFVMPCGSRKFQKKELIIKKANLIDMRASMYHIVAQCLAWQRAKYKMVAKFKQLSENTSW